MKISVKCCKANSFPDDDALAIDMTKICNSSNRIQNSVISLFMTVLFISFILTF